MTPETQAADDGVRDRRLPDIDRALPSWAWCAAESRPNPRRELGHSVVGRYNVRRSSVVSMSADGLAGLGRFAGPATLILSSLAEGAKHGYAITQDVDAFAGVKLQPGTLYGALARLEDDGMIEALPGEGRRRPYGITPRGAQ